MTLHRYDVPTMGQAARHLIQLRSEQDAQYWKERYGEVLDTLHGIIDSLNSQDEIRVVCGNIDITVKVEKLP